MIEQNIKQVMYFLENYHGSDKMDRLIALSNKIQDLTHLKVIPVYFAVNVNKPSDLGFDYDDNLCFLNQYDAEDEDTDLIIRAVTSPDKLDISGIINSQLLDTPETVRLTDYPEIDEIIPRNKKSFDIVINIKKPEQIINESVVSYYAQQTAFIMESYDTTNNIEKFNNMAAQAAFNMGSRIAHRMFDVLDRSRNYIAKNYNFEDESDFMNDGFIVDEESFEYKKQMKEDAILKNPSLAMLGNLT